MATIQTANRLLSPVTVDKFLGLNMSDAGSTQLMLGESADMSNCYIDKDYNLSKMHGYKQLITSITNKNIQGMWYGNISGKNYFIFACNGHVYKFKDNYWQDDSLWGAWATNTIDLGTLTNAPTRFFAFNNNLYIVNGYEYKKWTGTGTISDVYGYVPKIRVVCKPSTGDGTSYEGINLLTGKKRLTYKADSTTLYTLPEQNINSVDKVYVNGVLKTVTTHYTVNLTNGTVTFVTAPTPVSKEDDVEIYYTKGTGSRDMVVKNTLFTLAGEAVTTRVFLYGHRDTLNQRMYSSLADGIPSAEFFTSGGTDLIGSSQYQITDMIQQQANIITFTNQPATYYSYYDSVNIDDIDVVNFPIKIINETRGNIAPGQTQMLNNDIYTIDRGFIKWYPTTNKDERNMLDVGVRIQRDLNFYDLSKAITVDCQNCGEMWISLGKKVWIYSYNLYINRTYRQNNGSYSTKKEEGIFSRLELNDEPTCFINIDGKLFFGTTNGQIMKFDSSYLTYNGATINSYWEMNMYNFGIDYNTKTLNKSWITIAAQPNVKLGIKYVTNNNSDPTEETITQSLISFSDVHFDNFSFRTNYNPQPKKIRLKAKKFVYLKMVIENREADKTFAVLNFTLQAELGGQVK